MGLNLPSLTDAGVYAFTVPTGWHRVSQLLPQPG